MAETGLPGVDGPEDGIIDVLFFLHEFFFVGDELGEVFEVGGEDVLEEVKTVEEGDIPVVPKQLQPGEMFIKVDIIS